MGAKSDVDVWEFSMGRKVPLDALPVGCILTLAAAGSEMSGNAVITNMEENMKPHRRKSGKQPVVREYVSEYIYCKS